jgi:hypothetical protein
MVKKNKGSFAVNNKSLIEKYTSDPEFTYLVSFPRTGSHWLRMVMELYFEKPSLIRVFYYRYANDFTCYHLHDEDLKLKRRNVIYLYRNPVETIYSQMLYYEEDIDNVKRIKYWAALYGKHLSKWLIQERFTRKKMLITYEGMKNHMPNEFKKLCDYFSIIYNESKLYKCVKKVSKEEVKNKTKHDEKVINNSKSYKQNRYDFFEKYQQEIMEVVYNQDAELRWYV